MEAPIRVGIVGSGIRGSAFGKVVQEHASGELVGFVELNEERAAAILNEFGVDVHTSTETLLAAGTDAIVVATPDFAHLEPGLAALAAGNHVLFEKPLATTAEDAIALRRAAQDSSSRIMLGFENRWSPKFRAVRDLLRAHPSPLIAQRVLLQDTEFVPRQMLRWAAASTPGWFLFPHSLDMAMWLSDARPIEVYGRGVKKILAADGIDTYDRISASFLMSDGSLLNLDSGWVLPESRPAVFEFRYEIESHGNHIEIEIDDNGITHYGREGVAYVGNPPVDGRGRLVGSHIDMMRDFIDLCAGAEIETPGIDAGYEVSIAIAALHESLATNQSITIRY